MTDQILQPRASRKMPTQETPVRFTNRNQNDFAKTLRKRVNGYFKAEGISQNANTAMIIKTVVMLSAYILPFIALIAFTPPLWASLLLWGLMGFALAGIGMSVMHDANHGAYSKNQKVNKWVGYTLLMLGGNVYNWKTQHNVLHHTYTNIAGKDNDIDGSFSMRFDPHQPHKKFHKHQWYYAFLFYSIMTLYWCTAKDFVQFAKYKKEGVNKQTPAENRKLLWTIIASKAGFFGVFIGLPLAAGIPIGQILLGFLIMHIIGGLVLSLIFQLAHVVEETEFPLPDAKGSMEHSWLVHQLHTTANFARNNAFLNWYSGGLNHQVEHHLFPNICHVHYPKIAPIVKKTAKEFGFPYNEHKTFSGALKSHVRMLRRFGAPSLEEIANG
jgi:linoleoyl-CoA desaturase